jgi:sortase A
VIPRLRVAKTREKVTALIARTASCFFLAVGVFALSYAGYVTADEHTYQAIEQSKFEKATTGASEARHPAIEGGVIGEMEVPRLGLKAIFVQGDSPRILRRAVGHIPETALPGESGNVVLSGHRDTFFRPLRNIQLGDEVEIKTLDGEFEYRVESTEVVSPGDMQVLRASGGNTLTLVTCFPFYYVGAAPRRFIVRARQIGRLPADSSISDASSSF